MISKSSESAATVAVSSAESHNKAEEGRGAVNQMLRSMEDIRKSNEEILNQITESNGRMTDIIQIIQDIGRRTNVINEIAFQTKLLSFNASVEAARAGENGRGFASVAEEVRKLAQTSGEAAKQIKEMLAHSIAQVEEIVTDTYKRVDSLAQVGKEKIETGVAIAKQCSAVLQQIVINVSKVSSLSSEISQASQEQTTGVTEINKAVSQLDSLTHENSATSQHTAKAADRLAAQSVALKSTVDQLLFVINGTNRSTTSISSASKLIERDEKQNYL